MKWTEGKVETLSESDIIASSGEFGSIFTLGSDRANPVLASLWKLNFKFLQTYGAWKYPEWETAFRELPAVLKETNWVNELTEILKANEFSNINVASLAVEASTIVTGRKV